MEITLLWRDSVLTRMEFPLRELAFIVLAFTEVLVVRVETDKLLEARLLTFIEDTETALVHVSALPAPEVNK